jgi:phosphoglycerate dehydrogenase-like enzyme
MATTRIALLAVAKKRAEYIISQAPPGWDVTFVDNRMSVEEKIPLCKDANAIIVFPTDVSVDLLKHCPNVKLIQALSAGYDRLDMEAIGEMGIPVANNGGANSIAVSEHTIGLMISVGKRLMTQWDTATHQKKWRDSLEPLELSEITDKTVGIIGLGRIGKNVAKRLLGFDTRTIYYDTVEMPEDVQKDLKAEPVSLDYLLRESDIVTLHVPLSRQTRAMISDHELEIMKPTALLINACRGPVVDEKALYRALTTGQISAAGLDVLEKEPTPEDNPLFGLDNVVITPHMAGSSEETNERAAAFAYANIGRALASETLESLVFPE